MRMSEYLCVAREARLRGNVQSPPQKPSPRQAKTVDMLDMLDMGNRTTQKLCAQMTWHDATLQQFHLSLLGPPPVPSESRALLRCTAGVNAPSCTPPMVILDKFRQALKWSWRGWLAHQSTETRVHYLWFV
jgi:hypothetical protein